MKSYLPEMTYVEVAEAIERGAVALLPVGTIEGNAPHMPMGYDYLFAEAVAERVANQSDAIRLPGLAYGVSELLAAFPGTVFVLPEQLRAQIESILRSVIRHGFTHVLIISNHIPNQYPIEMACRNIRAETGVLVASTYAGMLAKVLGEDIFDAPEEIGHGGEPGTSIMMYLTPDSMRMDLLEPSKRIEGFNGFKLRSPFGVAHGESEVNMYLDLHELTPNGAMADPVGASEGRGEQVMTRIVEFLSSFIERFMQMDTTRVAGSERS